MKARKDNPASTFLVGLLRGLAGALLFALPMLMTMEMWHLGLYASPSRLLLLCVLAGPLLYGLARRIGFERNVSRLQALRDAVIAYALGMVVSASVLWMFGLLDTALNPGHNIAMIAFQSVPAGIGALLGRSQLGVHSGEDEEHDEDYESETGYFNELFMMLAGALFLGLNVAPTEEIILIGYKVAPAQTFLIVVISLMIMHCFVYSIHFTGGHSAPEGKPAWHMFVRFTLPGYVLSFFTSVYALWTFERLDQTSLQQMITASVILTLPAAIGAASARLVL
jgi:putative integral membrane protein (TIGR02587 family)